MSIVHSFHDNLGNVITRDNLESLRNTRRWTPGRKALVVLAVQTKMLTQTEALQMFELSEFELDLWIRGYQLAGNKGIATRQIQKHQLYRDQA